MKGKAILRSLLFAYLVTGMLLLLLAFLLFRFDLGEGPVTAGIVVIYVLSSFLGGFAAGKTMKQQKYLWGVLLGLCYFLLLAFVSFLVERQWNMGFQHTITTFSMCLGGGALGGMLS